MNEQYLLVKNECLKAVTKDPVELLFDIMQKEEIGIHGPEHHILDGSCSSLGAALAILHETGPLSNNQYYKDNLHFVSRALYSLAEVGGPRCCKRNAFLATQTAIDFVKEQYGIELPKRDIKCIFSDKNQQCLGAECPFFGK